MLFDSLRHHFHRIQHEQPSGFTRYAICFSCRVRWYCRHVRCCPPLCSLNLTIPDTSIGYFRSYSPIDGSEKWSIKLPGDCLYTPIIASSGLIIIGTRYGHLLALEPGGTIKWEYSPPAPHSSMGFYGSYAISEDTVIAASYSQKLYAISLLDGTLIATSESFGGPFTS